MAAKQAFLNIRVVSKKWEGGLHGPPNSRRRGTTKDVAESTENCGRRPKADRQECIRCARPENSVEKPSNRGAMASCHASKPIRSVCGAIRVTALGRSFLRRRLGISHRRAR